jgi:predicted metal-dependent phosphoesterase TrpH
MLAELHCHSIYSTGKRIISEGSDDPKDIVKQAKKLGIEILAITDHDNMDAYAKAKPYAKKAGILLIPGEEVSTHRGHMLALGIEEVIPPGLSVEESVYLVHKQGGIAIAAHPFDKVRGGMGDFARKCDAIEIFNSLSLDRSPNFYAKEFTESVKKPFTAGSDAHWIRMMGHGLNNIECSSIDSCLKAIKNSRNSITGKYVRTSVVIDWMVQRMKYSYYFTTNYMKVNYKQPKRFLGVKLMSIVRNSPENMDYFFRVMGYMAFGAVLSYSIVNNTSNRIATKLGI